MKKHTKSQHQKANDYCEGLHLQSPLPDGVFLRVTLTNEEFQEKDSPVLGLSDMDHLLKQTCVDLGRDEGSAFLQITRWGEFLPLKERSEIVTNLKKNLNSDITRRIESQVASYYQRVKDYEWSTHLLKKVSGKE
jgi:hypothetical protein